MIVDRVARPQPVFFNQLTIGIGLPTERFGRTGRVFELRSPRATSVCLRHQHGTPLAHPDSSSDMIKRAKKADRIKCGDPKSSETNLKTN